jgi:hypothetical protein
MPRGTAKMAWLVGLLALAPGCNTLVGIGEPSDRSGDAAEEQPSVLVDGARMHDALDDGSPDASSADAVTPDDASGAWDALDGAAVRDAREASPGERDAEPLDAATADARATSVRFRSSWVGGSTTDIATVRMPPFMAEHDLLWLTLYTDHASTTVTAPREWTLKSDRPNVVNDFHAWWYYRFADATEPTVRYFGLNQATTSYAAVVAYSGVDLANPFDTGTVVDTRGATCSVPSIRPTRSTGLLFLAAFIGDEAHQWSPLTPFDVRATFEGIFVADFPQVGPGDTPVKSVGCTPAGDGAAMVLGLVPGP